MFFDSLAASGIAGSFAQGESGGMPTFSYGAGMQGNPNAAAANYAQCIAAGGVAANCGAQAWQAGLNPGTNITTNKDLSIWDRAKLYGMGALGVVSGNPVMGMNAISSAANAKWNDLTVSRIATLIVGVVLIGAALFLLRSPLTIVSDKLANIE